VKKFSGVISILVVLSLMGCGTFLPFGLGPVTSSPSPSSITTTPEETSVPTQTPTVSGSSQDIQELTIWLPPQFDPTLGTVASNLLKERLRSFSDQHNGIQINVRIKAASGAGGLLDALTATNAAAPTALPDLIALSRDDLEAGALKGVLYPYDNQASTTDDPDWYSFARQMSLVQGSTYGMPFACDAMVMLYRPAQVPVLPKSWTDLLNATNPVAFPAADSQSLVTLALYESTGGQITDSQRRPALTSGNLATVLKAYEAGAQSGIFPLWLSSYDSDGQAWQAYKDKRANWVVTWVTQYLAELPADTSMLPLLPLGDGADSLTFATGWVWALGNSQSERRELSIELARWLVQSDFLSKWTMAAGYLPPRPTSLAGWTNQSLQSLLSQVVISAQLRPSADLLASLGPVLKDATVQVLKGQADAVQAAQAASEQLKGP
jgi:multiple sugar transport system substrate-binding protein